jgi:hypothetical protein
MQARSSCNPVRPDVVILRVPARLKRVGREMRMLVEGADDQTVADPSLLRVIARAHDIQGRLSQNTDVTVHDIAREERVTAAYIYMLLRLPWLAPDITTAIVNGRQPQQLSAKTFMRKASRLPAGLRVNSMASSQIPYATAQAISKRVSGNFFQGTGNFHLRIVASLGADRGPDVRFTPKADKASDTSVGLLCANSDLTGRSKKAPLFAHRRRWRAAGRARPAPSHS